MKKILALMLAALMLLSLTPVLAEEAAPADPQAEIDALNARIAELEALAWEALAKEHAGESDQE